MNNKAPNFSIKKSYNAKLMREQSKYIAYDENGDKIVYHNPVDGSGSPKTTSSPTVNANVKNTPTAFKMKKTIYSMTDR